MISRKGLKTFVLFTTALIITTCDARKQNTCPTQELTVHEGGKTYRVVWKSKSDADNAIVLSDPPCYNDKGNLVVRFCSNGNWLSAGNFKCHSIEKSSLCPLGFMENDKTCIYVTEPQQWPRNCPYRGSLPTEKFNYNLAWLPVQRKLKYGSFEYVLPDKNYGLQYNEENSSEDLEDAWGSEMDCLVKTPHGIRPSTCDSLHSHVCSHKYDQFLYKCPDGCVPGGLGSDYCFCKVNKKLENLMLGDGPLAVPRYSYERNILFELVGRDTCLIGDVQENSVFRSFDFGESLQVGIHKNEWGVYNKKDIECVVCKTRALLYPKIDLKLKFNSQSQKLYLNVYSPEGLFQAEGEDAVYCFTDATDSLKTRVKAEEVWDSHSESHSGRRLKVFKVSIVQDEPGDYWCEGFQLPYVFGIKSNTVVAHKKFNGRDYALRLRIYNFCRFSIAHCKAPSVTFINIISKILLRDRRYSRFIKKIRLFDIYNIDETNEILDVLLHLTTGPEAKLPLIAEYSLLRRNLQLLKFKNVDVVFFKNSLVCVPEATVSENITLHWKSVAFGTVTVPREFCVQETGTPVRRKCKGNFVYGAEWSNVEGICSEEIKISSKTEFLRSLLYSNFSTLLPENITGVTENSTDLTILDLYYLAEVLGKISWVDTNNSEEFILVVIKIIDDLMIANTSTLRQSQRILNSTDEILDNFECKLLSVQTSKDVLLLKRDNLVVHISRPFLNNISGLALYGKDDISFMEYKTAHLFANTSIDDLKNDTDLEVAVYLPEYLLNRMSENITLDMQTDLVVITTVYYTDSFFNDEVNDDEIVVSRIVSVSIPNYGEFLQTPIPILFKSNNKNKQNKSPECAFWNYGTASETCSGYWSTLGGDYFGSFDNTSLELCFFSHLTNFGLLVRGGEYSKDSNTSEPYNSSNEKYHDEILTVISEIGCTLSVLGISGIFITSIIFQSWREKVGTRILIQLCIALLLQIIFLNVATVVDVTVAPSESYCRTVGIILHYVTISEFSWMLVAAVLQFFRFVKVIGPMPNRIILKAMLIGWGIPIIPILLVCLVSPQSYNAGFQGICYPKGLSMYIGVLLPIAVIVSTNLAVFIIVIRNVFVLSIEPRGNSQTILKRQICLAILLFFLLGLPWTFGLLSEIIHHDSVFSYIFLYIFCLTATLQGFILFIFYVLLDKSTRTLWLLLFKNLFSNKMC